MPSEIKTANLGLNQWEGNEYPKRIDFVNDNAIIDEAIGKLSDLETEDKSDLVTAVNEVREQNNNLAEDVNELFQSVSNGKAIVAGAITDKGVSTSPTATFETMADNIDAIETDPSIGTTDATVADILDGKKAVSQGELRTGTMPNRGPTSENIVNLTEQNQEYTIAYGFHSGLRKIKAVIAGLAANVIKAGATVGGTLGTFTSDATATAAQMLSGAIAYVNGNKITGTIPSKSAQTYTPGTTNQTIAAGQYLSEIQTIAGDADLIAANIAASKNIFNVIGAFTGIKSIQSIRVTSSGAKTINSVVPANSIVIFQAYSQGSNDDWNVILTNSTTLTVSGDPASGVATIIEYEAGVIKSKQRITVATGVESGSLVTISSVDPTKSIVLQMSTNHGSSLYATNGKVTANTQLTVWRSSTSFVGYLEVIEFY